MKSLHNILLLATSALALNACQMIGNIDDIKPEYVLTDENVITSAATAQYALNGLYDGFYNYSIGTFRGHMSIWAGTLDANNSAGASEFYGNANNESSIKIDNDALEGLYTGYYYLIHSANSFISNLEIANPSDLSTERKNSMIGEARCIRGMAYLYMLRLFGEFWNLNSKYGLVLYQEPIRDNIAMPRSSVADCYDFIIKDLQYAAEYAPAMPEAHLTVSSTTALGLLARTYLSMGDYTTAGEIASQIIDNEWVYGYGLEFDYLSAFDLQYWSSEMLFAPYTDNSESGLVASNWSNSKPGRLAIALSFDADGNPDPRYTDTWVNVTVSTGIRKYPDVRGYQDFNSYYFMRMAEVYLIKAEVEARLGNPDSAREYLRPLCDRAMYDPMYVDMVADEDMVGFVLQNKILELEVECGEEWFDLVRYHYRGGFEGWTDAQLAAVPAFNQTLLPIPRAAMAGNNKLIQNPGY